MSMFGNSLNRLHLSFLTLPAGTHQPITTGCSQTQNAVRETIIEGMGGSRFREREGSVPEGTAPHLRSVGR